MTLAQIIDARNVPWSNPIRGSFIHRIKDTEMMQLIADGITKEVARVLLPVWYLAGCLCQESRFDPLCLNRNGHPFNAPLDVCDYGIAQLSGSGLAARAPSSSESEMIALAYNPAWAIAQCAGDMKGNCTWAALVRDHRPNVAQALEAEGWTDVDAVFALATYAYNSGRHGALDDLLGPQRRLKHPRSVMQLAASIKADLATAGGRS